MLGPIYSKYLKCTDKLGSLLPVDRPQFSKNAPTKIEEANEWAAISYDDCDRLALKYGNRYRGLGVSIGLIGAAVIFLAIAPFGLQRFKEEVLLFGILEAILLTLMIALLGYGRVSKVRGEWIRYRRLAENKRYIALEQEIERTRNDPSEANSLQLLRNLKAIVVDQRDYNTGKSHMYHNVERFGNVVAWASLFLAMVGTVLHVTFELAEYQTAWLIFLTAFFPAGAGVIHGINGFLRVEELVEDHDMTSQRLSEILQRLDNDLAQKKFNDVVELATLTLSLLSNRDTEWAKQATKLSLKPL